MSNADQVITILDKLGLTNYVVPFILIWTAFYAVTMKIKMPTDRADLNGILAFTIAYLFVIMGGGKMLNRLLPSFLILFLVLFIILLLYRFMGATEESVVKAFKNKGVILLIVGLIAVFTFVALEDWLIFMNRIPAWQVNESGDLIAKTTIGGEYPGNINNVTGKPTSIIVDNHEYVLIEGIYYKHGYEGSAYAIGSPQVLTSIFMIVILMIVTGLMVWPSKK